jgi:hypothetical protein
MFWSSRAGQSHRADSDRLIRKMFIILDMDMPYEGMSDMLR